MRLYTERRVKTVWCDETESKSFTPKKCFKTMREVKQVPKCKQVLAQDRIRTGTQVSRRSATAT